MVKLVHDQFFIFFYKVKPLLCSLYGNKRYNAASKIREIKEIDHHSIQRKKGQTAQ